MLTRKQILLRAVGAGLAAGLVVSAVMIQRQRRQPPPPRHPITLPDSVSWANRSVTRLPDGTRRSLVEAFVAEGKRFRLEVSMAESTPVIWVYDGDRLAVNVPIPVKAAEELDPRNTVLAAYSALPIFTYRGVKDIGEHACWAFLQMENGLESRFWVDVKSHVPRQVIIRYPDGRTDTQTYVNLPSHRTRQPGLFDPANLSPMLADSADAMLGR